MNKKFLLKITLPESLADFPVHITSSLDCREPVCNILPADTDRIGVGRTNREFALAGKEYACLKIDFNNIQWIEANGESCLLHLADGGSMTLSSNLSVVKKELPQDDFIQIHRLYIVNFRHVESMIGNSLKVGDRLLTMGREYRETLFDRFIFIGVRQHKSKK